MFSEGALQISMQARKVFNLMAKRICVACLIVGLMAPSMLRAAGPNSLILNEANTVSGGKYLGSGKSDPTLGRVQGNGQNWLEFLVTTTDPGKNTLDLRGYDFHWNYDKGDGTSSGSGDMVFSQDPIWASVPLGTMIVVNEFQSAWYLNNTPDLDSGNPDGDPIAGGGGMQRMGAINGFGIQTGSAYVNNGTETKIDFSSNTDWNPVRQTGGPDWVINVWAGQKSGGNFQYFSFSGSVTQDGVTSTVGVDPAAGLFVANNDNWDFTIKDQLGGNVVQGPIGEAIGGWGGGGVNSQELVKLEAFDSTLHPGTTLADYQNVTPALYQDGSSSAYGTPNEWDSGVHVQDFSPMQSWFSSIIPGDANLDGRVSAADLNALGANYGSATGAWVKGDFNGIGGVSAADLNILGLHYGQGPAPLASAAVVPEPSSIALLATGGLALALVWRRRRRAAIA